MPSGSTSQAMKNAQEKNHKMKRQRSAGIQAALASALFLGLTPIFGKQAILYGLPPMAVVAGRTALAAGLFLVVVLAFRPKFLYIYPAGLIGCFLAGAINGVGSLFYYAALGRIDAGLGQLLYAFYPLFVFLWMRLDRQPFNRLTLVRLILSVPALYLLTQSDNHQIDLLGMGMMLVASALYALHLPINQRVLYDMPAPTVTLYTLISMSIIVVPAFLLSTPIASLKNIYLVTPEKAWMAVLALTLVTFFSRITLFLGVKHLGGMQTSLLGLSELLVTITFAHLFLEESFSSSQWTGMALLVLSLLLVGLEKPNLRENQGGGWLRWLKPSGLPSKIPWQSHD
jgi:drug/metabolite transporter (DMT)-like permease